MPFFDLDNFLRAAQAVLAGRDLYALPDVYYPLPLYFIFIPLATLPSQIAHITWTVIQVVILAAVLRRRVFSILFFMPVLLTFVMGQIVIVMLGLFALLRSKRYGGVTLAVLVLKPQLVLFVAPWLLWSWWRTDRRQIVSFVLTITLMAICAFALQPSWLARWLEVSGQRNRAAIAPSLWGLFSFLPGPLWIVVGICLTVVLLIWAWRSNDFDILAAAGFLANPLIISYDLTILTSTIKNSSVWVGLTVISWVAFAVSAWQLNERANTFVTLVILLFILYEKRKLISTAKDEVLTGSTYKRISA